jgi:hypothetical protein
LSVAVLSYEDDAAYARALYADLRRLDTLGVDVLVAALPGAGGIGAAVADRLARAARGAGLD